MTQPLLDRLRAPLNLVRRIAFQVSGQSKNLRSLNSDVAELETFCEHYQNGATRAAFYSPETYKNQCVNFIDSLCLPDIGYRYSPSSAGAVMYANAFTILLFSLLHKTCDSRPVNPRMLLDQFQSQEDGLFRDPALNNSIFEDGDWWGARHFALIATAAYDALGCRPPFPLKFLERWEQEEEIRKLVHEIDWSMKRDDDNKIMNVCCLLQYSRDRELNQLRGQSVSKLKDLLHPLISPKTGLWGRDKFNSPQELSRAVQFSYHLYTIFLYDRDPLPYPEPLIDSLLATQNPAGGFAPKRWPSACEDIDSVHLLIAATSQTDYKKEAVRRSIERFFVWVFANQNQDGGFVFSRGNGFEYGHPLMASKRHESHLFATWFRTLSIAIATNYLWPESPSFTLHRSPGYYCF